MAKSGKIETCHRFDERLLACYRELLQTTNLQKAYQEWFRWFRFLRNELERRMPDYQFQGTVAENGMEYAYFQFASMELKEKGLKILVWKYGFQASTANPRHSGRKNCAQRPRRFPAPRIPCTQIISCVPRFR